MTEAEIIKAIRTGIREPKPKTVSDADIRSWITNAVRALGLEFRKADPRFFEKAELVTSASNVFTPPVGFQTIKRVWDIGAKAKDITEATQASPIVLTVAGHGLNTGDTVIVSGVGGNTSANGTWRVTVMDVNTFSLNGSAGEAAYTFGGKAVPLPASYLENFNLLDEIPIHQSNMNDDSAWFMRGRQIVVDDIEFENDLYVEYTYSPSVIEDIPEEYQSGLVAYPVTRLVRAPKPDAADYEDTMRQIQSHRQEWNRIVLAIRESARVTGGNKRRKPPRKGYMGAI